MSTAPSADSQSRCLVYCRMRPETAAEKKSAEEDGRLMELNLKSVNVRGDKNYQFDGTFNGESTQQQLFDSIGKPVVEHCLNGYRSALMAYGQTGTGKSFTLCCTKPGVEGIIPRAANLLFETIAAQSEERTFTVHLQFLQIYRDNLGDLMTESGKERVDIFFDKEGVTLPGCSIHQVHNTAEFMEVYNTGNARRVTTATAMNPESSRGHSALLVWVSSVAKGDMAASERKGKITFIDLAGYERFSKTGISNANAVMKDEAKTINASLLSLGHVVSALSNGDKHIPWRNSKLTRLLQDSIGGRSRTSIVLTVGPSAEHLFETTNTLQFGRAMAVKVQAKTTETVDYERLATKLQQLLNEKEEHINALEVQAASFDVAKQDLLSRHERDLAQMRGDHTSEIDRLREEGASDERILKILHQHEVERDNLIEQQKEELEYNNEQNETTTKELVDNLTLNFETEVAELKLRVEELEAVIMQKDAQLTAAGVAPSATTENSPARGVNLTDLDGDNNAMLNNTLAAYGGDNEHDRLKAAQLQAEVSRLATLCNQRAEDVSDLNAYVAALKEKLLATVAAGTDAPPEDVQILLEQAPKVSHVEMVDTKVVEEQERRWKELVAEREDTIEALRQELILTKGTGGGGHTPSQTPRNSALLMGSTDVVPMPLSARGPRHQQRHRGGLSVAQSSALVEQQRVQIDMLREELENANAEIAHLVEVCESYVAADKEREEEEAEAAKKKAEAEALLPEPTANDNALNEANATIAALKEELEATKQFAADDAKLAATNQEEMSNVVATMRTQQMMAAAAAEEKDSIIAALEKALEEAKADVAKAAAEAGTAAAAADVEADLMAQIATLKEQLEAAKQESLEVKEHAEMAAEIAADERDAANNELAAELTKASEQITAAAVAQKQLEDEVAALKAAVSAERAAKEAMEASLQEQLKAMAAAVEAAKGEGDAEKAAWQSQLDEARGTIAALQAAVAAVEAQAESTIADLNEQLAAANAAAAATRELPAPAAEQVPTTEDKDDTSDLLREQRDLFNQLFAGDRSVMFVKAEEALREQNAHLTEKLTQQATVLNEARVAIEVLKDQLKALGAEPKTLAADFLPRQINKIIDNTDLTLIAAFKEGELQLVHNKLEIREKSLYDMANQLTQLTHYVIELRALLEQHAPEATLPQLDRRWQYNGTMGGDHAVAGSYKQRKEAEREAEATDAIRAQLEGLLHLMKAMRKQNALLQTTVMERSIMVKHYAWMLMAHRALAADFDPETIVGTIAADLRLAFAERDEELATRDQHLLQRSAEVIVLEESVAELHAQLTAAGIVPCRPATKFAISTIRTREEMQDELSDRDESKARLIQQRLEAIAHMSSVERDIARIREEEESDTNNVELLRLRSRSEQLRSSLEVLDAKIKSQEREIDMLQHLISQSSRLVVEMQAQRDLAVDLSVVEKFKNRFLRK